MVQRDAHSSDDPVPVSPIHSPVDIADFAWKAPPGWIAPHWFEPEPHPPALPMTALRLTWCLDMLGWSVGELARRLHANDGGVRKMARGSAPIPNQVAVFMEVAVAHALSGPLMPPNWRPKNWQDLPPEEAERYFPKDGVAQEDPRFIPWGVDPRNNT